TTVFLKNLLFALGGFLINKIGFLKRFCIPAPVVGGLLFAALATILKTTGTLEISLDTLLQSLFMITFFTTIGLGA
ncbi:sodium/glutamate symporter, partial [Lysinibacillus sp. D4A3_S15]|uniref:sodium/glutamate symporter n=1 Tax=Lysinibacillus sp. D4A3_S15 TaxID=2941227 RepID=UPI0020BFAF4B